MFIIKSKSEEDAEERNRFQADDFTSGLWGEQRRLFTVSCKFQRY